MKLNLLNTLILGTVGVLGYSLVKGGGVKLPTIFDDGKESVPTGTSTPAPATPKSPYPLKRGSKGELVVALQRHLGIKDDGTFGQQTENALLQQHGVSIIYTATGYAQVMSNTLKVTAPKPVNPADLQSVFFAIYVNKQVAATYDPTTKLPATYKTVTAMRPSINWTVLRSILSPLAAQTNPAPLAAFVSAFDLKYRALTSFSRTVKNLNQTAYQIELPQLYAKMH